VKEVVPGEKTSNVKFTADKAGIFPIKCQLHPARGRSARRPRVAPVSVRPGGARPGRRGLRAGGERPGQSPDLAVGERVFRDNCAVCHGAAGAVRAWRRITSRLRRAISPRDDSSSGRRPPVRYRRMAISRTIVQGVPHRHGAAESPERRRRRAVIAFVKTCHHDSARCRRQRSSRSRPLRRRRRRRWPAARRPT
jgi:hypothetical protein